jgi:hypothetical protein
MVEKINQKGVLGRNIASMCPEITKIVIAIPSLD